MHESPLQPDDPFASYRVQCPTCRTNIWAANEPPPEEGDEIIAGHDCPGPADVAAESMVAMPEPSTPQPVGESSLASPAAIHNNQTGVAYPAVLDGPARADRTV